MTTKLTKQPQGYALIIVLWMVVLLSFTAATVYQGARTEIQLTGFHRKQLQAQALTEAGIWLALDRLLSAEVQQRQSLITQPFTLTFQDQPIQIQMSDLSGLVNLNHANTALLNPLLSYAGVNQVDLDQVTGNILDWVDRDSNNAQGNNERLRYQQAGLSYTPKNSDFATVSELRLVLGISEPVYQRLLPLVTIHGNQEQVNTNSASSLLQDILLRGQNVSRRYLTTQPSNLFRIEAQVVLNGNTFQQAVVFELLENRRAVPYRVLAWE